MVIIDVMATQQEIAEAKRQAKSLRKIVSNADPETKVEISARKLINLLRVVDGVHFKPHSKSEKLRQSSASEEVEEITPQQAAGLLGMSRQSVMNLIKETKLHPRKVRTRNKLALKEVLLLKESMERRRRKALRQLSALSEEYDF
ncbi:hypothetical protein K2X14_13905 [Acetobacter sp. TBRC 12305]|nr:hypothetical protein [Acetobacter garciniae]MBX0345928.1 hypothetical protein [Acetobacter garciniae]